MFLGGLLKKFSKNNEKRQIIREVIFRLSLDKKQEQLYFDSLDILDDEYLDLFYKKLTALIDIIEEKDIIQGQEQNIEKLQEIRSKEQKEKEYNIDFNILFDNI
ncbi:hypothetical protein GW819_00960 [Candidatus Gracilibacteria bacterium]|nr:hypothetical protein [Candidatus Gracilibacteria bacterium]PIQ12065.1 MAG: hypothetical protein COW68_00985 [Candidatus Gracilibacteria bacterium CG18_big_fil_WC_8_21_14_2_50_38_16]PIQ42248.1 MAG: hypothetical protein COW06_00220 [Candidatus Gracilibacteria bacterium CG12_big_fil_rev_8_21_14_0_65_38_15]PIZ01357.1 MAG: hypothetical protein COY60_03920 [Candidatus Gracilibacteria bacterium CG_4_10_14_0_8_um_filter_38_28]